MGNKILLCKECNSEFIFTENERAFYTEKGFTNHPTRCPECRKRRKYGSSRLLKIFVYEIQYKNRNPLDNSVLESLKDIGSNPCVLLEAGKFFYRARIITDPNRLNKEKGFWGYSKKESFVPPAEMTKDMRANYKYIPYLYCSNSPYVSLCEVRPRIGSRVSLAKIIIKQQLEIFDLTIRVEPKGILKSKLNLCDNLSEMFSTPISHDDDIVNYIPTQYIAEFIKNLGYDGIKYKSSYALHDSYTDETNFVIFNYNKCEVIKSNVVYVNNLVPDYEKEDGDTDDIFCHKNK